MSKNLSLETLLEDIQIDLQNVEKSEDDFSVKANNHYYNFTKEHKYEAVDEDGNILFHYNDEDFQTIKNAVIDKMAKMLKPKAGGNWKVYVQDLDEE